MKHLSNLSILALACAILVGCGGGGSVPSGPTPTPTPTPSPTPTLTHFAGIFRAPKGAAAASPAGAFMAQAVTVNLAQARTRHQAISLPDGTVLLLGGSSDANGANPLNTGEIFDPVSETVAAIPGVPTPVMSQARADFGAALLSNGQVFIIGGSDGQTFDMYDPGAHTFTKSALLASQLKPGLIKAYAIPDGNNRGRALVLILGGTDSTGTYNHPVIIDATNPAAPIENPDQPSVNMLALSGLSVNANDFHFDQSAVVRLSNGHLIISGGRLDDSASSASIYDFNPNTQLLTKVGNLLVPRHAHSMLVIPSNDGITRIHVYGGVQNPNQSRLTDVEEIRIPNPDAISAPVIDAHLGNLGAPRAATQAVVLQNGNTVHVGGVDTSGVALNTQMLYADPTNVSGLTGDMVTPRVQHTLTSLPTGLVLVAGGADPNGNVTNTMEIFDPQTSVYLQFASETMAVADQQTFKLVTGANPPVDVTAGTVFTVSPIGIGSFAGNVFTASKAGQAVITATNGSDTAKVTITIQ